MNADAIALTIDIDWANDEVISDTLALIDEYKMRCTLFMTHKIEHTLACHELAIHPYFKSLDLEVHISEKKKEFPHAIGTRSHALFDTYQLQPIYDKFGLKYQSNVIMYKQRNIIPYNVSRNILEIPIYFMDNIYMMMEEHPSFALSDLHIDCNGLKVFDFHPIHIYLNTYNMSHYNEAKQYYKNNTQLALHRNNSKKGIRNLFIELLEHMKAQNNESQLLGDIALRFFT